MFAARIDFPTPETDDPHWSDLAETYVALLYKDGHIARDYYFARLDSKLSVHARVARPDSLAEEHHRGWTEEGLGVITRACGGAPTVTILEDTTNAPSHKLADVATLYLSTHQDEASSPVRCGAGQGSLPAYLLPISSEQAEQLCWWQQSWNHHFWVWMSGGALEMPAYRELADPGSTLALAGRDLCASIERESGKPVFYELYRYYGREPDVEQQRRCPGCGGAWIVDLDDESWDFSFQCEACRLICPPATSWEDDEQERAKIGEWAG